MIFNQYINGGIQPGTMTLDQVFAWNIRYQILVKNQEEQDLLAGFCLVYGREVQVEVWSEWQSTRQAVRAMGCMPPRLLPIVFTTLPPMNLRGL